TLLEERFHLKTHRASEQVAMYAMRLAKRGLKLEPMKESDCISGKDAGPPLGSTPPCGYMTNATGSDIIRLHYVGFQLAFLARELSAVLDRHVIDETGVTGRFTIDLQFHTESAGASQSDENATGPAAPSVFKAMEEQLGLTLEKTTGTRGFLV